MEREILAIQTENKFHSQRKNILYYTYLIMPVIFHTQLSKNMYMMEKSSNLNTACHLDRQIMKCGVGLSVLLQLK